MRLCGKDCFAACANCGHWQTERRFTDEESFCPISQKRTGDMDKCDEFKCVHTKEVNSGEKPA